MSASDIAGPSNDAAVPDLTPEALDRLLSERGQPPVLLDLWAPWCQPCLAMAPALHRLAAVSQGKLRVAKLDTEAHPQVAKAMNVRGIPLLVLFREGREVARLTGLQSFEQLCAWVDEHLDDPVVDPSASAFRSPAPLDGAFYGDDTLRSFLLERVVAIAEAGRIDGSRLPLWSGDRGTPSCALVRHESPQVFTRVTGLSAALAYCLHFVALQSAPAWRELFDALPAGADTRGVAPRLLLRWMGDEEIDWPGYLGPAADTVRRDWLRLCDEWLHGEPPLPADWAALASSAVALRDPAPSRVIADSFGQMLSRLSPPPADDDAVWGTVLCLSGTYHVLTLIQREMGLTDEELGYEVVIHRWFSSRCPDPSSLTQAQMQALHERFQAENTELLVAHQANMARFSQEYDARIAPKHERLRAQLIDALREVQRG